MKRIIAIFLLLTAFSGIGADLVSHEEQAQEFALKRLVRYINGNFKISGKSVYVEILSDKTVPPGEPRVEISARKHRIYINPQDDWQRDYSFCRRLIHLLLRAKCGCAAKNLEQLPDWFICGMAQVISEQTGSARLIRNQHTFTLLDILAGNGCFGNPADVLPVKLKQLSVEEKMFFYEYSKLVMLTLDKSRGFSRLAVIISDDPVIDRKKFNAAASEKLSNYRDEFISPVYRKIMWSDIMPPPEELTLNCLEKALVSDVPELDEEGLPTGRMLKVRLEDFSKLANRDDFLFICRRAAAGLHTISVGESRVVRKLLADLRFHLEEEISHQTVRRQDIEKSSQKSVPQTGKQKSPGGSGGMVTKKSPVPSRKVSGRPLDTKKQDDADFDSLMKKSSDKDFQQSVRKFYKEKVVVEEKKESVAGKINRMFSAESKLDGKVVSRYIAEIKTALALRAELRRYLDETATSVTPVQKLIKFRKRIIYSGDHRYASWLESVSKELY